MNRILIAVDPGKHTCKAICKNTSGSLEKMHFRNKIISLDESIDIDPQGNSFKVEFYGKRYIIGDQGERVIMKYQRLHKFNLSPIQLNEDFSYVILTTYC